MQEHTVEILAYLVPGVIYRETLSPDLAMEPQRITDTLYLVDIAGNRGVIDLEAQAKMRPPKLREFQRYAERAHALYDLPVLSLIIHLIPDGQLPNPPC